MCRPHDNLTSAMDDRIGRWCARLLLAQCRGRRIDGVFLLQAQSAREERPEPGKACAAYAPPSFCGLSARIHVNMKRIVSLILMSLVLAILQIAASDASESYTIGGWTIGESETTFARSSAPHDCIELRASLKSELQTSRKCTVQSEVFGKMRRVILGFGLSGNLSTISFFAEPSDYDLLLKSLARQFGPPDVTDSRKVTMNSGKTESVRQAKWDHPTVYMRLKEKNANGRASFQIMSK